MGDLLINQWQQIANTSWPLLITIICFALSLRIYQLSHSLPLFHPLLISTPLVAWLVLLLPIDFMTYLSGNGILLWLLGPATVALAVPLAAESVTSELADWVFDRPMTSNFSSADELSLK